MDEKNTLIICASYHHNNTMKISQKMAEVLDATIIEPKDFDEKMLLGYDLIGFGSGIYNRKHHQSLLKLVNDLNMQKDKKAFVFSTSTVKIKNMHDPLNKLLTEKGFTIIGQFRCKGFMSYGFTKHIFGGLNKGRPNERDLLEVKNFALHLKGNKLSMQ